MGVIVMLGTIIFGLGFYIFRCRCRFAYGVFEIAVSVAVIFLTLYPQKSYLQLEGNETWWGWILSSGVGLSAGMYIMVRGLDNIDQGWPSKWESKRGIWKRVFYGQKGR
jgi:Na+/H+ antiporter NhaD/arsenite permease-like protein